jgi:hypothetical protein
MRYWSITFEWKTRPMYRKGRLLQRKLAIGAKDQTEALQIARAEGKLMFPRHQWKVLDCSELTR